MLVLLKMKHEVKNSKLVERENIVISRVRLYRHTAAMSRFVCSKIIDINVQMLE